MPPSVYQENWEKPTNHNPQTQTQQDGKKTKTNKTKTTCLFLCFLGKRRHGFVVENYVWKHLLLVKYTQECLHNFRCRDDLMAAVTHGKVLIQFLGETVCFHTVNDHKFELFLITWDTGCQCQMTYKMKNKIWIFRSHNFFFLWSSLFNCV